MTGNNPLVGIFQEMVQIHGDQIAVEGKSKSITYSELDHLSDQMAYGLREKGVKPGDTVGICLPRSLELAAVILAVLKCGAAYMPMDPSAPVSRNRTILERAEARLLVSSDDLGRLPCKTMTADKLTESSISDVIPLPSPYGRACIFHTSGSTGIPKGVEIMEAGILRTCHDPDYIDIRAGDRFACLSNPTFDALTFELFGSLLNGGILVIFTPERSPNAGSPGRSIEKRPHRYPIHHIHLVQPSDGIAAGLPFRGPDCPGWRGSCQPTCGPAFLSGQS